MDFASIDAILATVYARIQVKADFKGLRGEVTKDLAPMKEFAGACKRRLSSL